MMRLRIYTSQPRVSHILKAWAYQKTCRTRITSRHSPLQTGSTMHSNQIKHPMWLTLMHHQRPVSMYKNQSRRRCSLVKTHRSPRPRRCHAPAPAAAYHLVLVNIRPATPTRQMRPQKSLRGSQPMCRQTPLTRIQSLQRSVKATHRGKIETGNRRHYLPTTPPRTMPSRQRRR